MVIDYFSTIKKLGIELKYDCGEESYCEACDGEDITCTVCEGLGAIIDQDTAGWSAFPNFTGGVWGQTSDTVEQSIDSMLTANKLNPVYFPKE